MKDLQKVSIVIEGDDSTVRRIYTDGTEDSFLVQTHQLGELFTNGSFKRYTQAFTVPKLPKGCIALNIVDEANYETLIRIPGAKRVITYKSYVNGDSTYSVPFPDMLFHFRVSKQQITRSKAWALNRKGDLCRFPYTNVHSDGSICWGSYTKPIIVGPSNIDKAVELFYTSTFNDHLYGGKGTVADLFTSVQGKRVFPQRYLKKTSDGSLYDYCKQHGFTLL